VSEYKALRDLYEWAEKHPDNIRQGIGDVLLDRFLDTLREKSLAPRLEYHAAMCRAA